MQDDQTQRRAMVEFQLKGRGISDPAVLSAMAAVPRHAFVPPTEFGAAYDDCPLPIGYGQTISQPYIVALMLELMRVMPDHRVLEVGTGSGYQAAVLARLAREVYTIEIEPVLGEQATHRLQQLGFSNVRVKVADGYNGWAEYAPFDGIVVAAAAPSVPEPLIDQLKVGGRLVIPLATHALQQELVCVERHENELVYERIIGVSFVPFRRSVEPGK